jgi:hypothetical protein
VNAKRLSQFCIPFASLTLLLGGCAAVAIHPEGDLPTPIVAPAPAKAAVVVTNEAANYVHKESRASVDYEAQLGPSHRQLVEQIFRAGFTEAKMFETVDAARLEPGIMAIFEPRIEQFSFASARETGGIYCAVTIRYQIYIYEPNGELVDTLTLTGYGSGPAAKIGNGEEELGIAAYAAMRDAAAKFLTQFPTLELAKPLLASQALTPKVKLEPGSPEAIAAAAEITIEAVPINDQPVVATAPETPPAASPPLSPSQMSAPFRTTSP